MMEKMVIENCKEDQQTHVSLGLSSTGVKGI